VPNGRLALPHRKRKQLQRTNGAGVTVLCRSRLLDGLEQSARAGSPRTCPLLWAGGLPTDGESPVAVAGQARGQPSCGGSTMPVAQLSPAGKQHALANGPAAMARRASGTLSQPPRHSMTARRTQAASALLRFRKRACDAPMPAPPRACPLPGPRARKPWPCATTCLQPMPSSIALYV
jgi:hypothetical protein